MNLLGSIAETARRYPERVAFESEEGSLSYGRLLPEVLRRHDTPHFTIIHGHKSPMQIVKIVRALASDASYVPIDPSVPAERIDAMLKQLVKNRAFGAGYVMFTSGSTGGPKGVCVTLESIEAFVNGFLEAHNIEDGERWLNVANFNFDLSTLELFIGLASGGTIHALTKDDTEQRLNASLKASKVHNWVSTPSFADLVLGTTSISSTTMPEVRRFFFCGEQLKTRTVRELRARFPHARIYNLYGPTEATCCVTSQLVDAATPEPLPVGRSFGENSITSVKGEIVISGPQVALGYLGGKPFNHVFYTGDMGWVSPHGVVRVGGRLDRQVKVYGFRVELDEIERELRLCRDVEDAVVVQPTQGGYLRAYVLGKTDEKSVRAALHRSMLPDYMIPRRVDVRESFPLTTNGKIDVKALTEVKQ